MGVKLDTSANALGKLCILDNSSNYPYYTDNCPNPKMTWHLKDGSWIIVDKAL